MNGNSRLLRRDQAGVRDNHGPVRVASTYHFAYADGTPYEELGTTCYVWEWQPEALQEQTLKTLAASPFNKIRFCVFPKRYQWNTNEPILYPVCQQGIIAPRRRTGIADPIQSSSISSTSNSASPICSSSASRRTSFCFILMTTGIGALTGCRRTADDRYLHYVVARLAAYRNVWWSLANEWDFMKEKKESDFVRFGEIVSHDDPYHHLLSIHNGSLLFNDTLPWITHASIQNGSAVEEPGRAELYRDVYRKPVVYDEVKYEGNIESRWGQLCRRGTGLPVLERHRRRHLLRARRNLQERRPGSLVVQGRRAQGPKPGPPGVSEKGLG